MLQLARSLLREATRRMRLPPLITIGDCRHFIIGASDIFRARPERYRRAQGRSCLVTIEATTAQLTGQRHTLPELRASCRARGRTEATHVASARGVAAHRHL